MVTIRTSRLWMQAFAALLLLLAFGPGIEPSRTEAAAHSQGSLGDDLGKVLALKREQPGGTRAETHPERFDDDDPDATVADAAQSTAPWVLALDLPKIDSIARRSPQFCGASPRSPPSA